MDDNKNTLNSATQSSAPPSPTQQAAIVNGQPYQPSTSVLDSNFGQLSVQKPSKWRYFFIVLGILQILGVIIFFLIMTWAIQQAKAGMSGTEFISLGLFLTLVPAVGLIALMNILGLPIYMVKRKPQGKGLVFSILSLIISVLLALYGAYSVYQLRVTYPKQIKELSEQINQKSNEREQKFAADNAKPEISKEEAIELLKTCRIKGFYYVNQTDRENRNWGELSSTGVVLTNIDGEPYRISIADRLVPELVPIAREAQKTCGGPQFSIDGNYEQRQADGTWR